MAYFDCRVVSSIPVGENTLFVAEVIGCEWGRQGRATGVSQPRVLETDLTRSNLP